MRKVLAGVVLALVVSFVAVAGVGHAAQGTACKPGDTKLYVGPGSALGYLDTYDHNGDNYICVGSNNHGTHYYDNHFQ